MKFFSYKIYISSVFTSLKRLLIGFPKVIVHEQCRNCCSLSKFSDDVLTPDFSFCDIVQNIPYSPWEVGWQEDITGVTQAGDLPQKASRVSRQSKLPILRPCSLRSIASTPNFMSAADRSAGRHYLKGLVSLEPHPSASPTLNISISQYLNISISQYLNISISQYLRDRLTS